MSVDMTDEQTLPPEAGDCTSTGRQEAGKKLEWTGERYVPWLGEPSIGYEHIHRYALASLYVRGKRVLDLASGEGYGSHMLSETAEWVVGIDCDETSIRHANGKYAKANLEFIVGSILDLPFRGQHCFDVIVCFEAIEHVEDHESLFREVKRLLTKEGLFLASTPDKKTYSDEPDFHNPFHLKELYVDDFQKLFARYFTNTVFLGQRLYGTSTMWPLAPVPSRQHSEFFIARESGEFAVVDKGEPSPLYVIAAGSDGAQNLIAGTSILLDLGNELLAQREEALAQLTAAYDTLKSSQQSLAQVQAQMASLAHEHKALSQQVSQQDVIIRQLREELQTLQAINGSIGWKLFSAYGRMKDKLLPWGTKRRRFYSAMANALGALGSEGAKSMVRNAANDWAWEEPEPADTAAVFCNVCGWQGIGFLGHMDPESLICPQCGSVSRDRLLYEVFLCTLRDRYGIDKKFLLDDLPIPYVVVETSPRLSNPSLQNNYISRMREICGDYIDTDFHMENLRASRFEDLQNLTFPANSVDFLLCSHVIEHVADDQRAWEEAFRVLKPGGIGLFQMPIYTYQTYIPETAVYHEDRALVMRQNGWDVVDKMMTVGFDTAILVCDELFLCFESFPSRDFLLYDDHMFYAKYGHQKEMTARYPFRNFISRARQKLLSIYPFGGHEVFLCHKGSPDSEGSSGGRQ